jgi:predicted phage-related endonuclease
MNDEEIRQWKSERLGKITASKIDAVLAKPKRGEGSSATRSNYMAQLLLERTTGKEREEFQTWEMKRGIELEPLACVAYEDRQNVMVEACGFIAHPQIPMAGATPDGLVGTDGLVQFKVPNAATHLKYLKARHVPAEYRKQLAFELAVTGRKWTDFCSYHPDMPEEWRLFIVRYEREDAFIAEIEEAVRKFDAEIEEMRKALPSLDPLEVTDADVREVLSR